MDFSNLVYACAFNRIFGYNAVKARALADMFPVLSELFELDKDSLEALFGQNSEYVTMLKDRSILQGAAQEVEWAASRKIRIMCITDPDYPARLKECEDAPVVLFYRGNASLDPVRCISIVGTRKVTTYGMKMCRRIVEAFATLRDKPLIVSGLALGVDICAHRAALNCGLETVGVMATGLDTIYPSTHRSDAVRMIAQGGLITDFWRSAAPSKINFLRRNRIIAGLCDALILIESDTEGGGMVTARMADSYSRTLFALPGRADDQYSKGCNALIAEKCAEILKDEWSVLTVMGWGRRRGTAASSAEQGDIFESDSDVKRNILLALSRENGVDADVLVRSVGSGEGIVPALTALELEDRIERASDGKYYLK